MADTIDVKLFADAKLQAALDKALADLPPEKEGSLVAHADLSGASLTIVERKGPHWSIRAGAFASWQKELSAEVEIVGSWP